MLPFINVSQNKLNAKIFTFFILLICTIGDQHNHTIGTRPLNRPSLSSLQSPIADSIFKFSPPIKIEARMTQIRRIDADILDKSAQIRFIRPIRAPIIFLPISSGENFVTRT